MSESNSNIAVIGYSGEFPRAENVEQLWENILNGTESLEKLEPISPRKVNSSKKYINVGGFLKNSNMFDPAFFGIGARDALIMDPQQRKLLEHSWKALEHSGCDPEQYQGLIGTFVSVGLNTYLLRNLLDNKNLEEHEFPEELIYGNNYDYPATKIAYYLNLKGPALTIQTACSSSLVSIHEACQSLLNYQCDMALSGGSSIKQHEKAGYYYEKGGIMSASGHCKPFDSGADGTVFASGVGIVVLKRLEDALKDRDTIYSVIKGSAINNDGSDKASYMAPSINGQAQAIAMAQAIADTNSESIGYIEAHGTGTLVGDPIEIKALAKAFSLNTEKKQYCYLGSLKANIGHLEAAAGVAGLIKLTLMLNKKIIPPLVNFTEPNPKLELSDTPFFINKKAESWKSTKNRLRRGGVSSFGIGGTNAHVILEEFQDDGIMETYHPLPFLLILSSKTHIAIKEIVKNLINFLENNDNVNLANLAYTCQAGRKEFAYRYATVFNNKKELLNKLKSNIDFEHCTKKGEEVNIQYQESTDELAKEFVRLYKHNKDVQQRIKEAMLNHETSLIDNLCSNDKEKKLKSTKRFLQCLGDMWKSGYKINWVNMYKNLNLKKIALPPYPFEKIEFKYNSQSFRNNRGHANEKNTDINGWFYSPGWKRSDSKLGKYEKLHTNFIIFGNDSIMTKSLFEILKSDGKNVIFVKKGTIYKKTENNFFEIDCNSKKDYIRLFKDLSNIGIVPEVIIHLWSLNKTEKCTLDHFESDQYNGLYSLIFILQASLAADVNASYKLSIITNNLYNISGIETINPNKATIIGGIKVISKEHDTIECNVIDISISEDQGNESYILSERVIREIIIQNQEEIAFRNLKKWERTYINCSLPTPSSPECIIKKGTYLITGGLGHFGLDMSEYLSKHNNVDLILMNRSKFPASYEWESWIASHEADNPISKKIKRLRAIINSGSSVKVVSADVADRNQVKKVFEKEIANKKLKGVIHAAGIVESGIAELKELKSLKTLFNAKINGSYHLVDLSKQFNPDFILLCSSMNSIIGGLGLLDNTAANAFVDSFVDYCKENTPSMNIFALNWGAINESRPRKFVSLPEFQELSKEHTRNKMTDEEMYHVFDLIFSSKSIEDRLIISPIDLDIVLKNWNKVSSVKELTIKENNNLIKRETLTSLSTKYVAPRNELEIFLSEIFQHIIGVKPIGIDDDFFELGGHSLSAIQVMDKIKNKYDLPLHVMTIYENSTVRNFGKYVNEQIKEKEIKN